MPLPFSKLLSVCVSIYFVTHFAYDASAATLNLYFNDPQTNSAEMIAGRLSEPLVIGVFNEDATDAPEDFLTGWQLSLFIQPELGATGNVTIESPTASTALEPNDYLLNGVNGGISVINQSTSLLAFDFNFPATGGVKVLQDPATLVQLELLASADARGDFGVYLETGAGGTEWTDAAQGIQQVRSFANVPAGSSPVRIGVLSVAIPEPDAYGLAFSLIVAVLLCQVAIRRSNRPVVS